MKTRGMTIDYLFLAQECMANSFSRIVPTSFAFYIVKITIPSLTHTECILSAQ